MDPVKIFISYAREDEGYKKQLVTQLTAMQRNGLIQGWTDSEIMGGDEWDTSIKKALEDAEIIILLVSADFIASDYIHRVELKHAVERHQNNEVRIIPVLIRPCDFKSMEISKFNALPRGGMPISKWPDRDEAWMDVVNGLKRIITNNTSEEPSQPGQSKITEPAPTGVNLSQLKKDFKAKVVDNPLKALKMLQDQLDPDSDYNNTLIMQEARLNGLKRDETLGTISREQANLTGNQIRAALLQIVDDLEEEDIKS